jgi:hypothetical protein
MTNGKKIKYTTYNKTKQIRLYIYIKEKLETLFILSEIKNILQ